MSLDPRFFYNLGTGSLVIGILCLLVGFFLSKGI